MLSEGWKCYLRDPIVQDKIFPGGAFPRIPLAVPPPPNKSNLK